MVTDQQEGLEEAEEEEESGEEEEDGWEDDDSEHSDCDDVNKEIDGSSDVFAPHMRYSN